MKPMKLCLKDDLKLSDINKDIVKELQKLLFNKNNSVEQKEAISIAMSIIIQLPNAVKYLKNNLCQQNWIEGKICSKNYCPNCKSINEAFNIK